MKLKITLGLTRNLAQLTPHAYSAFIGRVRRTHPPPPMARNFSACQYEQGFLPHRLGNWQVNDDFEAKVRTATPAARRSLAAMLARASARCPTRLLVLGAGLHSSTRRTLPHSPRDAACAAATNGPNDRGAAEIAADARHRHAPRAVARSQPLAAAARASLQTTAATCIQVRVGVLCARPAASSPGGGPWPGASTVGVLDSLSGCVTRQCNGQRSVPRPLQLQRLRGATQLAGCHFADPLRCPC